MNSHLNFLTDAYSSYQFKDTLVQIRTLIPTNSNVNGLTNIKMHLLIKNMK